METRTGNGVASRSCSVVHAIVADLADILLAAVGDRRGKTACERIAAVSW